GLEADGYSVQRLRHEVLLLADRVWRSPLPSALLHRACSGVLSQSVVPANSRDQRRGVSWAQAASTASAAAFRRTRSSGSSSSCSIQLWATALIASHAPTSRSTAAVGYAPTGRVSTVTTPPRTSSLACATTLPARPPAQPRAVVCAPLVRIDRSRGRRRRTDLTLRWTHNRIAEGNRGRT